MLKDRSFIRDFGCFIILLGLIRYNIEKQYIKHASTKTIAKHVARKSLEKITDTVSDTFSKLGKITRRKERDVQNVLLEESVIFAEQPKTTETGTTPFTQQSDVLLKQLEVAQQKLDKDDTVGSKQRETFERDIKDI